MVNNTIRHRNTFGVDRQSNNSTLCIVPADVINMQNAMTMRNPQ